MHAQLTTPRRFFDATTGDVYVSGRRVGYFSGDDVYCDDHNCYDDHGNGYGDYCDSDDGERSSFLGQTF